MGVSGLNRMWVVIKLYAPTITSFKQSKSSYYNRITLYLFSTRRSSISFVLSEL